MTRRTLPSMMKVILISSCILSFVSSWAPQHQNGRQQQTSLRANDNSDNMTPRHPKALLQGALLAGMLSLAPLSSQAAVEDTLPPPPPTQSIQINANLPALLQLAKDNQEELLRLAKSAAQYVRIDNLPANKIEFVRDAVAGDVLLTVNGIPIDISLLSEKGSIDVALSAAPGDISVTVASPYLPQLPLAAKRTVSADVTTTVAERTNERLVAAVTPAVPLWDQTTLDVLGKGWTNRQVVGSAALALGVTYGGSYLYYEAANQMAEREAAQKKKAMAAKRQAAKAAANVKPPSSPVQSNKEAVVAKKSVEPKKEKPAAKPKERAAAPKPKASPAPVASKYVVPQD